MNLIIPMAGKGTRMRPHTLTIPKPFIPVAGKPIIERLIMELCTAFKGKSVKNIGFVVNDLDKKNLECLVKIAEGINANPKFYTQNPPSGTAHAISCAHELLSGEVIIAYADTLFKQNESIDYEFNNCIWVKNVANPSSFGVVKCNEVGVITDFVEKPQTLISNLAVIGIYCFKDGLQLSYYINKSIKEGIKNRNEYELTFVLEMMKNDGIVFCSKSVDEWLDCGNAKATLYANERFLKFTEKSNLVSSSALISNSVLIQPVFIGNEVEVTNSVIGPYVSISNFSKVKNSCISNSIIQSNSVLQNANISQSLFGNFVNFVDKSSQMYIGDYNDIFMGSLSEW